MKITAKVTFHEGAFRDLEKQVTDNVRRRLEAVTCPVHGTRVEVVGAQGSSLRSTSTLREAEPLRETTAGGLRETSIRKDGLCCDALKAAIDAALR